MQKPFVIEEVAFLLQNQIAKQNEDKRIGGVPKQRLKADLQHYLGLIDKKHFMLLRDGLLSYDQVKARLNELHNDVHYKVLDDYRDSLQPAVYNANDDEEQEVYFANVYRVDDGQLAFEEILKKKEDWMFNPKCLRSLFKETDKSQLLRERKEQTQLMSQEFKRIETT